jgi:hypothetical protein
VRTTFLDGSSLRNHWETFTSSDIYSNFFFSIHTIGGFEGVTTSSAMIESSPASTKTKKGS